MEQIFFDKKLINLCNDFIQKTTWARECAETVFYNKKEDSFIVTEGYKLAKISSKFFNNQNIEKIPSGLIPFKFIKKYQKNCDFYLDDLEDLESQLNGDFIDSKNTKGSYIGYEKIEKSTDCLGFGRSFNIDYIYKELKNAIKEIKEKNSIYKLKKDPESIIDLKQLYIKIEIKGWLINISLKNEKTKETYLKLDFEASEKHYNNFTEFYGFEVFFKSIELFKKLGANSVTYSYNANYRIDKRDSGIAKLETDGIKVLLAPKRNPEETTDSE